MLTKFWKKLGLRFYIRHVLTTSNVWDNFLYYLSVFDTFLSVYPTNFAIFIHTVNGNLKRIIYLSSNFLIYLFLLYDLWAHLVARFRELSYNLFSGKVLLTIYTFRGKNLKPHSIVILLRIWINTYVVYVSKRKQTHWLLYVFTS